MDRYILVSSSSTTFSHMMHLYLSSSMVMCECSIFPTRKLCLPSRQPARHSNCVSAKMLKNNKKE